MIMILISDVEKIVFINSNIAFDRQHNEMKLKIIIHAINNEK